MTSLRMAPNIMFVATPLYRAAVGVAATRAGLMPWGGADAAPGPGGRGSISDTDMAPATDGDSST